MIAKIKQELIKYGNISGVKGFTPGISGNISARVGENILITSSGSANGYLTESDFVLIDFEGNIINGNKKPSSEKMLHVDFYKKRDDINCIFHVHSPYLTAFATSGIPLTDAISPEIIYCFGEIPIADYALPGSYDLVKNTSKYFANHDVMLMANHGVIIGGSNIQDAYLKLELCEGYAKTILCSKLLGGAKILPDEEVKKVYALRQQ